MQKLSALGIGPKIGIVALPFLALAIILTLIYPEIFSFGPEAKKPLIIAGIVVMVVALILYAATARALLEGVKNNKLMTTGPFRYCQNPLYALMILLLIPGIALLLNSWVVLITSVIAYIIFKINIHTEYEEMEKFFGEEYREYQKRTPEFFPLVKTLSLLLLAPLLILVSCDDDNDKPANDYRLKEWITSHSSAITTRLVFDYQDDKIIMHRNYSSDSNQYARVEYLYENNSIEQKGYMKFDEEWEEQSSKNVYEYEGNRMVRRNFYSKQDEAWILSLKTEYVYSNGLLSRESWWSFENDSWTELSYTLYYYGDDLPVKTEVFARLEDDVMRKLIRKEADYDGNKLISVYSYDYQTDTANANFKHEFHYEDDRLVQVDYFSYNGGWIPAGSNEFTYDSEGNLVTVIRKDNVGDQVDLDEYSYEQGKGNYEQLILPGGGLLSEINYPHPTKALEYQFWLSNRFLEIGN